MKTPPKKIKIESDVQLARGRLRGALNESINNQESDDDGDGGAQSGNDEENELMPQRGRPNKEQSQRNRRQQLIPIKIHLTPLKKNKLKRQVERQSTASTTDALKNPEPFVMKLFDRSLDLARYSEKTPLYPICRAWMANQPRNSKVHVYERRTPSPVKCKTNAEEVLEKLRNGSITELYEMPTPKPATIQKIPMPLVKHNHKEVPKDIEQLQETTKEELLAMNMKQWKLTKQNWLKHVKEYNKRYEINYQIIDQLFKR